MASWSSVGVVLEAVVTGTSGGRLKAKAGSWMMPSHQQDAGVGSPGRGKWDSQWVTVG